MPNRLPKRNRSTHNGRYEPDRLEPFEISRSSIDNMVKCEACWWLEKAMGLKKPGTPPFALNTNTDTLLKRDHDRYRGKGPSPIMEAQGIGHLRPFFHPDLEMWTESLRFSNPRHFNAVHEETNILFGGGIDDVFENPETGELHIIDYKSTSQEGTGKKIREPFDETFLWPKVDPMKKEDFKAGYRRQADMYQWILRKMGFKVSNTAYFIYVDGLALDLPGMLDETDTDHAWMKFEAKVISYEGDDSWVEAALYRAKELLQQEEMPEHGYWCMKNGFGKYIQDLNKVLSV